MFNNNINKPAITVFLPLTSAAGKNYFCRDGFFRGKKPVFTGHWQKLANPAENRNYRCKTSTQTGAVQTLKTKQHLYNCCLLA